MATTVNYTDAWMRKPPYSTTIKAAPAPTINAPGGNLQGGAWATTTPRIASNPTPQRTASTVSNGGGGGAIDQWVRYHPGEGDMPAGYNGETNGEGQGIDNLISDMYNPYMSALDKYSQSAQTNKDEDLASANNQWNSAYTSLDNRGGDLTRQLDEQARILGETGRNAAGENVNQFNQANQQGMARYGQGSSVGQAVGELARVQYLKNQGNLNQQQVAGEQDISGKRFNLHSFLVEQKGKYDLAKNDIINQINQKFRDTVNEINMRKGEAEANKTNAKLAALQQSMQLHAQVETASQAARQNLATFAVQQLASLQGSNFDVGQIPKVYTDTLNRLNVGTGAASAVGNLFQQITGNPLQKRSADDQLT